MSGQLLDKRILVIAETGVGVALALVQAASRAGAAVTIAGAPAKLPRNIQSVAGPFVRSITLNGIAKRGITALGSEQWDHVVLVSCPRSNESFDDFLARVTDQAEQLEKAHCFLQNSSLSVIWPRDAGDPDDPIHEKPLGVSVARAAKILLPLRFNLVVLPNETPIRHNSVRSGTRAPRAKGKYARHVAAASLQIMKSIGASGLAIHGKETFFREEEPLVGKRFRIHAIPAFETVL